MDDTKFRIDTNFLNRSQHKSRKKRLSCALLDHSILLCRHAPRIFLLKGSARSTYRPSYSPIIRRLREYCFPTRIPGSQSSHPRAQMM